MPTNASTAQIASKIINRCLDEELSTGAGPDSGTQEALPGVRRGSQVARQEPPRPTLRPGGGGDQDIQVGLRRKKP